MLKKFANVEAKLPKIINLSARNAGKIRTEI
jgi:hypothetical protein